MKLAGLTATTGLQQCAKCEGYTVLLRDGRCLICHRDHLADTIDREAKEDDACSS